MAESLLVWLPKLTEKDRENIALAIRCCGRPDHPLKTDFPDYLKAAPAIDRIALSKHKEVLAALCKAAHFYLPALDTIRKLQSK
jgi:hypothetical protein